MEEYSRTVLVVEDEPLLLSMNELVLRNNGYTVLSARCGREALQIAETHKGRIDLLLTDLHIPGVRGDVLADRLSCQHENLKVLLLTGSCCQEPALRDVLQKPFDLDELLCKVQEVLL